MTTAVQRFLGGRLRLAALLIGVLALVGFTASSASASPGQVVKMSVAGAQFSCNKGTVYTAVSGDAVFLMHESTDAAGGFHVTGTVAPSNVLLTSGGVTYRLTGADWFGGNTTAAGGGNFTGTEHFQILGRGGPVADVSIVAHFTVLPDGTVVVSFERNTGICTVPEG